MNKKQFLDKLEKELKKLNPEERKRQLDYFEEMINDRIDEGKTEEQAVWEMGTVQGIASKIMSEISPEQLQKKIGTVGWILIALAALLLIGGTIVVAGFIELSYDTDVEDMIEQRLDLDDGWLFSSGDAQFDANEISAVNIVWSCGDVTLEEAEGSEISVKVGNDDAIEYQVKDGTLFIETRKEFTKGNCDLKVYIPEDILQLNRLDIVTTEGRINADCEYFAEINIVTVGGDVRLNPEDCARVNVTTVSGNVLLELDEDNAFVMEYNTAGGDVSVSFDRGFVNESGNSKQASYDHSRGSANALILDITTDDGDIKVFDD